MFLIGIRVANYLGSGAGHLNRCIEIRKCLKSHVTWFLDDYEKKISHLFPEDKIFIEHGKESLTKSIEVCKKNKVNLMLVDSYIINNDELKNLKDELFTVFLNDRQTEANINMFICPQPINLNFKKNIKYLVGPRFAPISFSKNRKINYNRFILVSMGMYDSKGVTLEIVKVLKKLYEKRQINFKTFITLGSNSPILNNLKREISKSKDKITLQIDTKNMYEIYNKCVFAIGAPGLSHLERLASGLPSILISQTKNHELLINKWKQKWCALVSQNNRSSIERAILKMNNSKRLRKKIGLQGQLNVDGKGAARISNHLTELLKNLPKKYY